MFTSAYPFGDKRRDDMNLIKNLCEATGNGFHEKGPLKFHPILLGAARVPTKNPNDQELGRKSATQNDLAWSEHPPYLREHYSLFPKLELLNLRLLVHVTEKTTQNLYILFHEMRLLGHRGGSETGLLEDPVPRTDAEEGFSPSWTPAARVGVMANVFHSVTKQRKRDNRAKGGTQILEQQPNEFTNKKSVYCSMLLYYSNFVRIITPKLSPGLSKL
ncbi:hypothetical protein SFRURICE_006319 [Spodoptera frugiperda]|uniref:SFRICE_010384 n=1 Tax=Spodoptera frugiperda TaxID=7108 RepID=A0A2H1W641_SPOFR|nr:hypothetical protein SFRURICE_006319 [Spodoptera frugiperda]